MGSYHGLIKQLRAAGRGGEKSERLQGFEKWIYGETSIEVENEVPEGGKESVQVAIAPFSLDVDSTAGAAQYTQVLMTEYGFAVWQDRITPARLSSNQLGWQPTDPQNRTISSKIFTPAKVMLKVSRSGAATNRNKRSGMTGQTYVYTPSRAPKVPFGRNLATDDTDKKTKNTVLQDVDYAEAAKAIKDKLTEVPKETLLDFNFYPEVLTIETKATKQFSASLVSDVNVT